MRKIEFDGYVNIFMRIKEEVKNDRISVYSAQASFFLMVSAVPFISLMMAVAGIFLPFEIISVGENKVPSVSLLSLSAITTLWSAARGFAALRHGIERVYGTGVNKGYFRRKFQALINTLVFIVFINGVTALLLFGEYLFAIPRGSYWRLARVLRLPFAAVLLFVSFNLLYYITAKGSRAVPQKMLSQSPGAVFSALGWIVFYEDYSHY